VSQFGLGSDLVVYPNSVDSLVTQPPAGRKSKSFDELAYLARYFDTVEINTTFYRPGNPQTAASWVKRVEHNTRLSSRPSFGRGSRTSAERPGQPTT